MAFVDVPTTWTKRTKSSGSSFKWFTVHGKQSSLSRRRGTTPTRSSNYSRSPCAASCALAYLLLSFGVALFFLTTHYLLPPGVNLFSGRFWRCSHRRNSEIDTIQASFPVHIEDDFEIISHPGFLFSEEEKLKVITNGMNISRSVNVPRFWNPAPYGENGVRDFLGSAGKFVISKEEAQAVGSFHGLRETIFIAVASYRDPECLPTVEDIFLRAKYPERIRVGIVDQISEGDTPCNMPVKPCDQNPEQTLCKYGHLIDYIYYPARFMVGPTFARHIADRMYRGEYFSMQVDSHVRFVADWDEDIISQWKSIGNEMAVISNYMSDIANSIDPDTHQSMRETRSMMCRIEFEWPEDPKAHIRYMIQPNNKPRIKDMPMLQPFWAAGFSFGRGHFTVQVPYDQYLPMVFQGEEISMSVRGFTFGYDFYAPARNVAFHIYAIRQNREVRSQISKFSDNEVLFPGAKKEGYLRLNGIIGLTGFAADYNSIEEERYGLGQVRSTDMFYRTFGIKGGTHQIEGGLCDFVQGTGGIESMHLKFSQALRFDSIGIDYSRITYEHAEIERTETSVDQKELAILQQRLRKRKV